MPGGREPAERLAVVVPTLGREVLHAFRRRRGLRAWVEEVRGRGRAVRHLRASRSGATAVRNLGVAGAPRMRVQDRAWRSPGPAWIAAGWRAVGIDGAA